MLGEENERTMVRVAVTGKTDAAVGIYRIGNSQVKRKTWDTDLKS